MTAPPTETLPDDQSTSPFCQSPNFESCGGILKELDDGHTPELHTHDDASSPPSNSKWVHYPFLEDNGDSSVHVYDDAVPAWLVDALYETTVQEGQPWGTYVTLQQVESFRENRQQNGDDEQTCCWQERGGDSDAAARQHALSVQAVSYFLALMTSNDEDATMDPDPPTTQKQYTNHHCIPTLASKPLAAHLSLIHGVAVWALASSESSRVPYHVDYAEWIRYRYNVLVPPLWAGTLQCSRFVQEGGAFAVQRQGWSHYERHGYKGCKTGGEMGGWTARRTSFTPQQQQQEDSDSSTATNVNWDQATEWVTIPYRYNRCIGHTGTLPHLSTPFVLQQPQLFSNQQPHRRVIVGFNVFGRDIGHFVQEAPEHSHEFRRRVQAARQHARPSTLLSLEAIRKHPALTKWLVLAKREKIKRDWHEAQNKLDDDIQKLLLQQPRDGKVRVASIVERLARTDGTWPNAVDVQVHLQRRMREGKLVVSSLQPVTSNELSANDLIYLKS